MNAKKQEWGTTDAEDQGQDRLESPRRGFRLHNMHLLGAGAALLALLALDPFLTAWVGQFRASLTLNLAGPSPEMSAPTVNMAPPLSAYLPPRIEPDSNP